MHTLILAENLKQATFIQKGLQYENLSADVLEFHDMEKVLGALLYADGVYIVADGPQSIETLVNRCKEFKEHLPIILLTPRHDQLYEKLFLAKKIVYFYIRPFPFRNMAAEMRYAIFKEREKIVDSHYIIRDLELDLSNHSVKHKNRMVFLRNKEFALLHYFMLNRGKILSRTELLESVWDRNANILTNTVDVHISQLRKKIDQDAEKKYIHTIPCAGYIFD